MKCLNASQPIFSLSLFLCTMQTNEIILSTFLIFPNKTNSSLADFVSIASLPEKNRVHISRIATKITGFQLIVAWLPHLFFTHLPCVTYWYIVNKKEINCCKITISFRLFAILFDFAFVFTRVFLIKEAAVNVCSIHSSICFQLVEEQRYT